MHAATDGFGDRYSLRWAVLHRSDVDVAGTTRLLDAAGRAGARHFIFTSIVGVDRVPGFPTIYRYFKHKIEAERLVRESSLGWTIVRFTQFHPLLDEVLEWQFGRPGPVMTLETLGQPIDPSDAADALVAQLSQAPSRDVVEIGGPEILEAREITDAWKSHRGTDRKVRFLTPPGKMGRALSGGALTTPDNMAGRVTWTEWLARTYS
ncbi:MAG: SDR family oxidoreductase [Actinomycetota bacterium]